MHRRLRRIIGYTEFYQLFKFLVRILAKQPFNSRPVLRDAYVVYFSKKFAAVILPYSP